MRTPKRLLRGCARGAATLGVLLFVVLALAGCFEPDAIAAVPATATLFVPQPTEPPPTTPTPVPTARTFPLAAPVHVTVEHPAHQTCIECHTDAERLKASATEAAGELPTYGGQAWASSAPRPVERWELVYLSDPAFLETMHGRYGCIICHGGVGDTLLVEVAHTGLIAEPSAAGLCADCHAEEVSTAEGSLHASVAGYRTVLLARSESEKMALLETMLGQHCEPCHTATCGQCHVSRAAPFGGGLVAAHLFEDTPSVNLTCAGCHDTRIVDGYQGQNESGRGDVHWIEAQMPCTDCHGVSDFHGTEEAYVHRYDGPPGPSCDASGCHDGVSEDDGIAQHGSSHLKNLSCQACHSAAYQNCYSCHVTLEDGAPGYTLEASRLGLKIGRNPIQGRYRPWKYVPVRHVPVAPDSFAAYGDDLLPNFDALPTWKYTTPHTIQRITPQNQSCNSCHGNAGVFLTAADVAPEERNANRRVIVEQIPKPVD